MTIVPLVPDEPVRVASAKAPDSGAFSRTLDAAGNALARADGAEDAFASHAGSLQDAVFERAQADVVLSIATAAARRTGGAIRFEHADLKWLPPRCSPRFQTFRRGAA